MKSIISGAVLATAIVACLALNLQAKPVNHVSAAIVLSDTGKMDKMKMNKMKMDKKMEKKKMKMDKMKMDKMKKDTAKKM